MGGAQASTGCPGQPAAMEARCREGVLPATHQGGGRGGGGGQLLVQHVQALGLLCLLRLLRALLLRQRGLQLGDALAQRLALRLVRRHTLCLRGAVARRRRRALARLPRLLLLLLGQRRLQRSHGLPQAGGLCSRLLLPRLGRRPLLCLGSSLGLCCLLSLLLGVQLLSQRGGLGSSCLQLLLPVLLQVSSLDSSHFDCCTQLLPLSRRLLCRRCLLRQLLPQRGSLGGSSLQLVLPVLVKVGRCSLGSLRLLLQPRAQVGALLLCSMQLLA